MPKDDLERKNIGSTIAVLGVYRWRSKGPER